jgi:site-specific DNA recombinase
MNAISWAAVSSKPQADRESLHDQHRLNHALAEALDWEIVADITVSGESRSYYRIEEAKANVTAYQELADYADAGHIDWLIVKDRSRLARTRRLNRQLSDYLQDHNIRVYSRTMPPSSTEERTEADVWGEAIESGYSEAEVLRLKQRREMGMQARIRAGKMPATPPWGFKRVADGRGDISYVFADPRAEEAVRHAITRYQQGVSMLRIVHEAREKGIKTCSGNDWTIPTVRQIIFQPAYYSLAAWGRRRTFHRNGRKVTRRLPPEQWLIAEADFAGPFTPADWSATLEEAQRRAEEHPRRRGTRYPLSGIFWCAHCDRPMHGTSNQTQRYYRCTPPGATANREPGPRHYVSLKKAHRQLGEELRRLMLQPDWLAALSEEQPPGHDQHERSLLLEQVDELERRRKRWMDAYEDGAIELSDFSDRIGKLLSEEALLARRLERLDDALAQEQAREDWLSFVQERILALPDTLSVDLSPSDSDELRKIATTLWNRITVEDHEIIGIDWASP